jgi:hypothetical protein
MDSRAVPNINLYDQIDLGGWLERTEQQCRRVGEFHRLVKENEMRTLRRMETLGIDKVLMDLPYWWDRMTGAPPTSGMSQDKELPTSGQKMDQGLATGEQGAVPSPRKNKV